MVMHFPPVPWTRLSTKKISDMNTMTEGVKNRGIVDLMQGLSTVADMDEGSRLWVGGSHVLGNGFPVMWRRKDGGGEKQPKLDAGSSRNRGSGCKACFDMGLTRVDFQEAPVCCTFCLDACAGGSYALLLLFFCGVEDQQIVRLCNESLQVEVVKNYYLTMQVLFRSEKLKITTQAPLQNPLTRFRLRKSLTAPPKYQTSQDEMQIFIKVPSTTTECRSRIQRPLGTAGKKMVDVIDRSE